MAESDFNQNMLLKNRLFAAAENFGEDHTFSNHADFDTVQLSKEKGEQLKFTPKVVDIVVQQTNDLCNTGAMQFRRARNFLN